MKKTTRSLLKNIFSIMLALSLCMSMLTSVAMASEAQTDDPPVNVELILPDSGSSGGEINPDEAPADTQLLETGAEDGANVGDDAATEESATKLDDDASTSVENGAKDEIRNDGTSPTDAADRDSSADKEEDSGTETADEIQETDASADDDAVNQDKGNGGAVDEQSNESASDSTSTEQDKAAVGTTEGKPDESQPNSDASVEKPESDNASKSGDPINADMNSEEIEYSDKGMTSDGLDWEMTKDSVTGKYTLTIKFNTNADDASNFTEEDLAKVEQYAAEVSAALAEKYGMGWEWDSAATPSGSEQVHKFQVFLTGDDEKSHTYRYDAEKLEQMDGEFTLEKVDKDGNPITGSETSFQLWHINEITDPVTSETVDVKMFCSYDPKTNIYTFIPTESTIQTINGRIEILYAMMKDTVYFLQEVKAPSGYEIDPSIHIIMEKDVWESEDESFRDQFSYLGEFAEDEDGRIGLDVEFVDVENGAGDIVSDVVPTPVTAPNTPGDPIAKDTPAEVVTPDQDPAPDKESIPNPEPMPDKDVTPDPEDVPESPIEEGPSSEPETNEPTTAPVSTNDIPKTGDTMYGFALAAILSAIGLFAVTSLGRRKIEM